MHVVSVCGYVCVYACINVCSIHKGTAVCKYTCKGGMG